MLINVHRHLNVALSLTLAAVVSTLFATGTWEPDVVLQVHIHFSNFLDLDQETIFCIKLLYCIVIYCSVLHNLKLWFCWFRCSNSDNMFTSSLLQVQTFLGIRRHLLSKHFHKLLLPSFGPFLWASWESTCYPPAGLLQRGEAWFAALWPYGWKVWHPQPGGVTNTTRIQENPRNKETAVAVRVPYHIYHMLPESWLKPKPSSQWSTLGSIRVGLVCCALWELWGLPGNILNLYVAKQCKAQSVISIGKSLSFFTFYIKTLSNFNPSRCWMCQLILLAFSDPARSLLCPGSS